MLSASIFFILGSGWIMDRAYAGDDWVRAHELGLIMGIPTALILVITLLLPRFGAFIGVLVGGLAFLFWAMSLLGDMEGRLVWSLTIGTAVYFVGAMLVLLNNSHLKEAPG